MGGWGLGLRLYCDDKRILFLTRSWIVRLKQGYLNGSWIDERNLYELKAGLTNENIFTYIETGLMIEFIFKQKLDSWRKITLPGSCTDKRILY